MSEDASGVPPEPQPTDPQPVEPQPPGVAADSATTDSATTATPPPRGPLRGWDRALWDTISQGNSTVVTILAILLALVLGGLLIAFSDTTVLHAWASFFSAPGAALSAAWQSVAAAYSALFEGAIVNPHTITAAFHGGSVGAIFYPLSQTASQATPLILTGLSVALAFRAGLFNIGAASQWIGGAIVVTYLGYAISLPPVIHIIVCLAGGFAGGAVLGWLVGDLKARTGAHEVIVTIMLNYVMYNFLSYLLGTPTALQLPGQDNLISPNIAVNAQLPHVGGPPPQVGAGFLVALAAAGGMWWLLSRSTVGFEFRTVGANPSAARSAGMSVGRTWALAMLLAGGLAGLSGAVAIQGTFYSLNFQSYGTYGITGITVALLGRARPLGVVLAALLFGALDTGGTVMQAATSVPVDITEVLQGLIVLSPWRAPPLIRAVFRLRQARASGMEALTKEVERMTALATVTRAPVTVSRRHQAAAVFVLFGLVNILLFGLLAHSKGDATFAFALPGASVKVPSIQVPAAPLAYILGAASILIGVARATIDESTAVKRLSIAAVLVFFVISLLAWADTGSWANGIPVNVVSLLQGTLAAGIPLILGALAGCMGEAVPV